MLGFAPIHGSVCKKFPMAIRLINIRRGFCTRPGDHLSLQQGLILNRFSGTCTQASDRDLEDTSRTDDDFDSDLRPSPIVAQAQNSKPVLHRGLRSPLYPKQKGILAHDPSRFRSKRAEDLFKRNHMIFDGPVRVRVMDVDEFRLDELHHYFMYTLVRRFPAEKCVRVASRIALFRDKNSQHSFESMSKDVAAIFGPIHGAELSALFSRCYNTIPVAFILDYIRRFGKFSRKYIAQEVDKTMNPRLFDFVRYASGVKPLPGIVTRPHALRSFAKLLPPCAAKRFIFQHLLAHFGDANAIAQIEKSDGETALALLRRLSGGTEMDPQLGIESKVAEGMASAWKRTSRPIEIEGIASDVYSRRPVSADDIIEALENDAPAANTAPNDPLMLQSMQVQPFKSPLMEDTDELQLFSDKTELNELSSESNTWDDPEAESWWKQRRTSSEFFRHNKKAYRLFEGEGWKQVEDPRGETPDYERSKKLRESKHKLSKIYPRRARVKARNEVINRTIERNAR